jgi:hypothetical protein
MHAHKHPNANLAECKGDQVFIPAGAKVHCPSRGCNYASSSNEGSGKVLNNLSSAVTHYHRMHSGKPFVCDICNTKRYALKWELKAHQKQCKMVYTCADISCRRTLGSDRALFRHCDKFNHAAPLEHEAKYNQFLARKHRKLQQMEKEKMDDCIPQQHGGIMHHDGSSQQMVQQQQQQQQEVVVHHQQQQQEEEVAVHHQRQLSQLQHQLQVQEQQLRLQQQKQQHQQQQLQLHQVHFHQQQQQQVGQRQDIAPAATTPAAVHGSSDANLSVLLGDQGGDFDFDLVHL